MNTIADIQNGSIHLRPRLQATSISRAVRCDVIGLPEQIGPKRWRYQHEITCLRSGSSHRGESIQRSRLPACEVADAVAEAWARLHCSA